MKGYLETAHRALGRDVLPSAAASSADVTSWPLSRFAASRLACLVRSALLGEDVVFAGNSAKVPAEWAGVAVYRGAELKKLLEAGPEDLAAIHQAKKLFGATVTDYAPTDKDRHQ